MAAGAIAAAAAALQAAEAAEPAAAAATMTGIGSCGGGGGGGENEPQRMWPASFAPQWSLSDPKNQKISEPKTILCQIQKYSKGGGKKP